MISEEMACLPQRVRSPTAQGVHASRVRQWEKVKMIVHRFNRIAWGQVHRDRSRGVIAAGMENGELALWDPAKIISNAEYVYLPTLFIG
jgi:hypothetical protein